MCNLSHYVLCFIWTTMFPRSVSTRRRVHVRVCAQKKTYVYTLFELERHEYA